MEKDFEVSHRLNDKYIKPVEILPWEAVQMLTRAAKTPVTEKDPLARLKAIEEADRRIRRQYPRYFRY